MRRPKILITASIGLTFFVLFFFTSAPLKTLEIWLRINGFEASDINGQLLSRVRIGQFADENSKRRLELTGLLLQYGLTPSPHIQTLRVDSLALKRQQVEPLRFASVLREVKKILTSSHWTSRTQWNIQKISLNQVRLNLFENAPELFISRFEIENINAGPDSLNLDRIEAESPNLSITKLNNTLSLAIKIPNEYFLDIKENLTIRFLCSLGNDPTCLEASFFNDTLTLKNLNGDLRLSQKPEYNTLKISRNNASASQIEQILQDLRR